MMATTDGPSSNQSNDGNVPLNAVKGQITLENSAQNGTDASAGVNQNDDNSKKPVMTNNGTRVPYVNFFKTNRMVRPQYKLEHRDTGAGKIKIGAELVDSVERTYGICLLGYVISGKPPSAALFDLTKRWGSNIKFQTYDNGWIVFSFPSIEVKERVLNGGTYMVYGYHLFLKEMPRCFRFRDEDMNSLPMWVQIHGLPLDCWNFDILSIVSSRVGIPIHMDMLTHDRKKCKFARVLIEVDASKPRVDSLELELMSGDVNIRFVYEQEIKYCDQCKRVGHAKETCGVHLNSQDNKNDDGWSKHTNNKRVNSSRSRAAHRNRKRSDSQVFFENADADFNLVTQNSDRLECSNAQKSNIHSSMQNSQSGIGTTGNKQQMIFEEGRIENSLDNEPLQQPVSCDTDIKKCVVDDIIMVGTENIYCNEEQQRSPINHDIASNEQASKCDGYAATKKEETLVSEQNGSKLKEKGKEVVDEDASEEEIYDTDGDDVDFEVDLDDLKLEDKRSKNQKKKEKKKAKKKNHTKVEGKDQGKNEILKEFLKDMEDNSSGDTEYFLGSNNPKNVKYFGNVKKGRQPKIASDPL